MGLLTQILWYMFYFTIGAVIEYFNLKFDLFKKFEKLIITMKKYINKSYVYYLLLVSVIILTIIGGYEPEKYNFVYLGLTAILIIVNFLMFSETNEMRKAQTQPNVYVAIQPVDELSYFIELFVQNIGLGSACNINFEVSDFHYTETHLLSEVYLIKNGIGYLAPNQKMQVFIMQSYEVFEFNSKDPVNIIINYTDENGDKFKSEYKIDFMSIKDVQRMKDTYTNFESALLVDTKKISKSIEDISSNIKTIANTSIDTIGYMYTNKLIFTTENVDERIKIAKALVLKILLNFYYEWDYSTHINGLIPVSTFKVQSIQFFDVAASIADLLPQKISDDLLSLSIDIISLINLSLYDQRLKRYEEIAKNAFNMYTHFESYFKDK